MRKEWLMSVAGAVMASTVASANPAQPVSDTSPTTNTCEPNSLALRFMGVTKSGVTFCEKGQKAIVPIDQACGRIDFYIEQREALLGLNSLNKEEFRRINPSSETAEIMKQNVEEAQRARSKLTCEPLLS